MSDDEQRCKAEEWQRDGRGLWAMRQCLYSADFKHPRHEFGSWRYNVQLPARADQGAAEIAQLRQERDELSRDYHEVQRTATVLVAESGAAEARVASLLTALDEWRCWAQFVYGGGGPVEKTDAELRAMVCAKHDEETQQLRDAQARLLTAVDTVLKTFRKDEAQGFRSRDRAFAIDVLGQAVASAPASERSRTVALSMEDAAAIHRWLELVIDDRKFFNPVEAALTERATVEAKGRLAAELAKR